MHVEFTQINFITLRQEHLNSYSQQFNQYQQDEQPPLTSDNRTQKRHVALEIKALAWDKHKMWWA